jgi:hypothetical protein
MGGVVCYVEVEQHYLATHLQDRYGCSPLYILDGGTVANRYINPKAARYYL